jgi:hypothetical protein
MPRDAELISTVRARLEKDPLLEGLRIGVSVVSQLQIRPRPRVEEEA